MSSGATYISFVLTSLLYAAASVAFFVLIARGSERAGKLARLIMAGAAASHLVFLVGDSSHARMGDVRQMLTVVSLAIVGAFIVSARNQRMAVLGAFITPVTLLLFLAAGLGRSVPAVPENVRSALLPAHVVVNVLGVAAFTLAFAVATAYLIQERLLRRRQLGGLFNRLPPLDVLDSMGLRLLLIGFPLFTLGSVSGAIWAAQMEDGFSPTQVLGLVAWAVFGLVLLLRIAAGWQGRRAAIGTLLGCACALAVVAGYALRDAGGAM